MKKLYKLHSNSILILGFETLLAIGSIVISFLFRFKFEAVTKLNIDLLTIITSVVLLRVFSYLFFKTSITTLRYTNLKDLTRVFSAVFCSSFLLLIINGLGVALSGKSIIPFSVILIDSVILLSFIVAYRVIIRFVFNDLRLRKALSHLKEESVLILGTSSKAVLAKRAIEAEWTEKVRYLTKGFLGVNHKLKKKKIEGLPCFVLSETEHLPFSTINYLLITDKDLYNNNKEKIDVLCLSNGIKIIEDFSFNASIETKLHSNTNFDFKPEELLNRDVIELDIAKIHAQLSNKTILVSGAAGSIGSEICRQLINFNPLKIILLDQAETPLYEIENELLSTNKHSKIEVVIADVADENRMKKVFTAFNPQVVFHAAAYKHVPMMELNPIESIKTNIFGTYLMSNLSVKHNVEKFVFISTDKAVNPTNVMGASKRVAEIYIQALNYHTNCNTKFVTTRFGNVLGSNGSVIPLFKKQLQQGGPLTVTHPEITRYFMTIPEACQLVLEAGTMGKGGEIYIFDMGKPVKIVDLAKSMVEKSGLKLGKDIKISFVGLRQGEKLYEELLADKENTKPTYHDKIMIAQVRANDYESTKYLLLDLFKSMKHESNSNNELVSKMKQIVPEFISNNSEFEHLDQNSPKGSI